MGSDLVPHGGVFHRRIRIIVRLQPRLKLWRLHLTISPFWALRILFILVLMLTFVGIFGFVHIYYSSFPVLIQLIFIN